MLGQTLSHFRYIQLTPFGSKRHPSSFGQLKGLEYILTNHENELQDYILFLDSDDWLPEGFFKKINKYIASRKYEIIFNKTINIRKIGNKMIKNTHNIKRKVGQFKSQIWPTISPTSSIIISKKFLKDNKNNILNYNMKYSDLWLDARINILSMNLKPTELFYSDIPTHRLIINEMIHEIARGEDSLTSNFSQLVI